MGVGDDDDDEERLVSGASRFDGVDLGFLGKGGRSS